MKSYAFIFIALVSAACSSSPRPAPTLNGPGVLRASAFTCVKPRIQGESGWVLFPIPGTHGGQVPLTFDLAADPPDSLKTFRWRLREDGRNWLCEAEVAPPAGGATIRWESLVLVPDHEPVELPRAEEPDAPGEAAPWLRSTACVQSDDPEIAAKARELAESWSTVNAYVEKVLYFTSRNQGRPGVAFDTLDARKALLCGGSCTSRANLAAALLRARGIPARTQAHLPSWWVGPLYEHWLVEYWHPGAGWIWIEPSLGRMQLPSWSVVVLNVANPEDEDRAFDPCMMHSGVMPGAPYLAVHQHSEELLRDHQAISEELEDVGNFARIALRIKKEEIDMTSLFERAGEAFALLKEKSMAGKLDRRRTDKVETAIDEGDPAALSRALKN